jgi:hypothetical protein
MIATNGVKEFSQAAHAADCLVRLYDSGAAGLAVLLLEVRDTEIRAATDSVAPQFSADEVDGPRKVIAGLIDRLAGVFSDKDDIRRSAVAKELTALIGKDGVQQLMTSFPDHYDASDVQRELLLMEVDRINRIRLHINGLRDKELDSIENAPAATGMTPFGDAVAWIQGSSASVTSDSNIDFFGVLEPYVSGCQDLADPAVIDEIHRQLVPRMAMETRHIVACAPTLSCASARPLFEMHLRKLHAEPVSPEALGEHLFAGLIGYHPYPDGNGRAGRALYAIDKLRKQSFQRPTTEREDALCGLGDDFSHFGKMAWQGAINRKFC